MPRRPASAYMIRVTDARQRTLVLGRPPRTIVSLVPSDTYSLAALGAADRLVGRTRYCTEPASVVASIPAVGGTKDADVAAIVALRPDLIIANQEENSQRDIEQLTSAGLSVYVSFPKRVAEGLAHLARLALLLGVEREPAVRARIADGYAALRSAEASRQRVAPVSTFLPIWMDPLMTIHGDTFISDALDLAGARNVFADRERRYPLAADLGQRAPLAGAAVAGRDTRYPRVTHDELVLRAPDLVILTDEPHSFSEADADVFRALDLPAARRGAIVFASGKDFSWYGARALEGLARVRSLVVSFSTMVRV